MKKVYKGIDVSTHNGKIDWNKVYGEIDFAMIRCGYGKNGVDAQFKNNADACKGFGIPFGVYFFSYAMNTIEAKAEARRAIELCKEYEPTLGIAFDYEEDSLKYAISQGHKLDASTIRDMACAFLDTIANESIYNPILYASKSYYLRYFEGLPYYFWLAQWNVKEPGLQCDMWQFTSIGKVNGIFGFVDMNYTDYIKAEDIDTDGKNINGVLHDYNIKYLKAAENVIKGVYGNGEARKSKLKSLGYDAKFVQDLVNAMVR